MNNNLSFNLEWQEMEEKDLREINGGYGYWEGHNQASAVFSAIVSDAWNDFCTEFGKAYSEARKGR